MCWRGRGGWCRQKWHASSHQRSQHSKPDTRHMAIRKNAAPCSAGLEPTSFYTLAAHPSSPQLLYAGAADIRGIASEDGGASWRVMDQGAKASANSIYGFAFHPDAISRVYVATGKWHDYPMGWYAGPLPGGWPHMLLRPQSTCRGTAPCIDAPCNPSSTSACPPAARPQPTRSCSERISAGGPLHDQITRHPAGNGGIFVSEDRGRTFARVGPTSSSACADCNDMVGDFLALAYDVPGGYMYAGGHINGIARLDMRDARARWQWINFNLLGPDLWQNETVIPKIEVRGSLAGIAVAS